MPTLPTTENIFGLARRPVSRRLAIGMPRLAARLARGQGLQSWGLSYRAGGKRRHVTLGQFLDMGLAAARKAAEAHRVAVDDGATRKPCARPASRRDGDDALDQLDCHARRPAADSSRDDPPINVDIRPVIGE